MTSSGKKILPSIEWSEIEKGDGKYMQIGVISTQYKQFSFDSSSSLS
jgi:hypothetical protein